MGLLWIYVWVKYGYEYRHFCKKSTDIDKCIFIKRMDTDTGVFVKNSNLTFDIFKSSSEDLNT